MPKMTAEFFGELDLRAAPERYRWILRNEHGPHQFGFKRGERDVLIPPDGMTTDLGSIPRPLTSMFPREEFRRAYVIHDWGYWIHGLTVEELRGELKRIFPYHSMAWLTDEALRLWNRTRAEWDGILYEAILVEGGEPWRAEVIYWHVRWWAWIVWKKKEQRAQLRRISRARGL